MAMTDQILTVARAYCAARGMSLSRLSTIIFDDGKKLDRIASGRDLHTARYEAAMGWLSDNWPDGVNWPKGIARPEPLKESA